MSVMNAMNLMADITPYMPLEYWPNTAPLPFVPRGGSKYKHTNRHNARAKAKARARRKAKGGRK